MTHKAVLCGINTYQSQTNLRGCINDVKNMSKILTQFFGFDPANIHQLTDEKVVKKAILDEYEWLLEDAQKGDHLIFHFSGHGSYVPDEDGDETDGTDEILCLYNLDFYDPETYLKDDEWKGMLQNVPEDIQLTLIFDSCHSGTGTREFSVRFPEQDQKLFIDEQTTMQRRGTSPLLISHFANSSRILKEKDYQNILEDQSIVLHRFIAPPTEFQERIIANARTRGMRSVTPSIKKHLLLTGCRDNQTSADAYIEKNFHGAFTYYFCKTLREEPNLKSQQTLKRVAQRLKDNGFFQEPQYEGVSLSDSLFGDFSIPVKQPDQAPILISDTKMTDLIPSPENHPSLAPENQKLLIEAYLKLLDTLGETAFKTKEIAERATANRYLVYVHGISTHVAGYSDSWWSSLKPFVSPTFGNGNLGDTRREVLWSDLVNKISRSITDMDETKQLRREIEFILEERKKQMLVAETGSGQVTRQALQSERGGDFSLDDFLIYMVDANKRRQIIERFTNVVGPLLASGGQVDIISHSWGTVVAYEGLRELEGESLAGRVSNFFTVGSALSIGPVRASLRDRNKDGDRPTMVNRWFNLDAKGDLVGGVLGDQFEVDHEYLKLEPTECRKNFLGFFDLGCAHGSYFKQGNTITNRDIFAKQIKN